MSPRVRKQRRRAQPSFRSDTSYMMRGMTDMGRMAVGGIVIGGTIGMLGSAFKQG